MLKFENIGSEGTCNGIRREIISRLFPLIRNGYVLGIPHLSHIKTEASPSCIYEASGLRQTGDFIIVTPCPYQDTTNNDSKVSGLRSPCYLFIKLVFYAVLKGISLLGRGQEIC